jgi:hypothetical protein
MSRIETPEDLRDVAVERAGDAAQRVADAAGGVGDRISKRADRAAVRSGVLGVKAGSRVGAAGTKVGVKGSKLGLRGLIFGTKAGVREKLRPARDAKLKADLVRTSRELAHEASDLESTVESLKAVIADNRQAGAKGRTRLIGGVVLGAIITYHLDVEHGAQRRAATAQRLKQIASGRAA